MDIDDGPAIDLSTRGDEALIVTFYERAVLNRARSEADGVARYDNREYVRILVPGQKLNVVDQPARDEHRKRFPRAYQAYREGREQRPEGTPIESWPYLTPAQVAELRALSILTVEQMAGLSDAGLQQIGMGARDLQTRAKAFLAGTSAENQQLRGELDALKAQLAELTEKKKGRAA